MGRIRIGALLIFFAAGVFPGCSQEGNLVVRNDCQTEFEGYVDDQFVEIAPGDEVAMSVYIGKKALVIGPNDIDVEISGSAWTKKPFVESISIQSDETTIYPLVDDVGAIIFQNAYSLQINDISIKQCDSLEFGEGLLSKTQVLSPGTAKLIQLDEGCWDILVNYGREQLLDTVTGIPDAIGQVIRISWIPGYTYQPGGRADKLPR
jgi:hypothetical protein